MDDVQRETQLAQDSPGTTSDESREVSAVVGTGRLLANPRRVRRA